MYVITVLLSLSLIDHLSMADPQFIFPGQTQTVNQTQLERRFPFLPFPVFQQFPVFQPFATPPPVAYFPPYPNWPIVPTFPTPTIAATAPPATQQTCICVPIGTCTGVTPANPTNPSDGSGIINIRIVNNPPSITPPPTTPATCFPGLQLCCLNGPYQCGVRYPPVAGSPVPAQGQAVYGSYPWQAVILGPNDVYQGSGFLIDPRNVLTVAHRVANFSNFPTQLRIRMGEWNAAGDTEPLPAQEFLVVRIIVHPSFNAANLKNDLAVLRLSVAVPLGQTPTITTGCLPVTSFVGQRCFVSGWGKNDFVTGSYQTIQKQVDVPILAPSVCQSALSATILGSSFVFDTNSFLCAGGEVGKDSCTGDGGSPLVCQLNGRWFVAGLVAWGIGCATTNIPGVYVNIANFLPWIQSAVATT